jgi:hypothetical protein
MVLFWPENESKIYILVSFQHMLRLYDGMKVGRVANLGTLL